jgi:hypothetical protein
MILYAVRSTVTGRFYKKYNDIHAPFYRDKDIAESLCDEANYSLKKYAPFEVVEYSLTEINKWQPSSHTS